MRGVLPLVVTSTVIAPQAAAADCPVGWYARRDCGYFKPPLADVNAPSMYMRLYLAPPVRFTRPGGGTHTFWDVGFGEEFFVLGFANAAGGSPPRPTPTGVALFIDGDMHMLLDFDANSAAVIDSEFRIGGGLMGRGLPYWTRPGDALSHLAWRAKFFHESTHLGDEYLGDALAERDLARVGLGDPAFIPFRRVNVSYEAWESYLAVDAARAATPLRGGLGERLNPLAGLDRGRLAYGRLYAGYRRLLNGPYDPIQPGLRVAGDRNEVQVGAEVRLRTYVASSGWRAIVFPEWTIYAYEAYLREQYDFDGDGGDLRRVSHSATLGWEWGNVFVPEDALRFTGNYYNGINPHGQFRSETLRYFGATLALDL